MAIIVRAGAGEACCIMGLIHIKDLWQEKGGHTLILSTGSPGTSRWTSSQTGPPGLTRHSKDESPLGDRLRATGRGLGGACCG